MVLDYQNVFEYREEVISTKPKKSIYYFRDNTYGCGNYPSWKEGSGYHKKQAITYYLYRNLYRSEEGKMSLACELTRLISNNLLSSPIAKSFIEIIETYIKSRIEPNVSISINKPKVLLNLETPEDIAELLYNSYGETFILTNNKGIGRDQYYRYLDGKWNTIDGEIFLMEKIRMDIAKIVEIEIVKNIKSLAYKNTIIKECREFFYDKTGNFWDNLDESYHLLNFNNGIYDLDTHNFRPARANDFISLSTKNNYIYYEQKDPIISELLNLLNKIIPSDEDRNTLFYFLNMFLKGGVKLEPLFILNGPDLFAKKFITNLLVKSLGDYICKLPTNLISKDDEFNPLNTSMYYTKGKRIAVIEVYDDSKEISETKLRELTNGEVILTRKYYNFPIEFKPQFSIILCCENFIINNHNSIYIDDSLHQNTYLLNIDVNRYKEALISLIINYEKMI